MRAKLGAELSSAKDVIITEGTAGDEGKLAAQKGMRRHLFCLCPAGDTPSSARLFDAIVSGCIPVVVSDELELPFEGLLDYRKIAVIVSSGDATQPGWLVNHLRSLSPSHIKGLQRNLAQYARHFLYSNPAQPLGPEDLTWKMISGKVVNMKLHTRRSQKMVKGSRSICRSSAEKMDLVSSLPDEVRTHILSFLTTKEAALTSVLSKKWHNLFASVPSLVIDDSVFLHPEEGKRERDGILQSLMDFVDRVLALQGDSTIKKFSLKCTDGVDPDRVNSWICNVLQRGVSELDLSINFLDEEFYLPREMFVSKTLVKLRLASEFGLHWWTEAEGPFLPMLKSLYMYSEMRSCDVNMETFLSCFPVVEEVEIISMDWIDSVDTVSSATLRKLTFHATGMKSILHPKSISFDTPNLHFLAYSDWAGEDYPLVNMNKLAVARIALSVTDDETRRIRTPRKDLSEGDVVLQFGNVVKLMNGIQNVQELHLHPDTMEVLSLCCDSMPVFNNLKMLIITSDEDRGWQAMPALLRNCPQLDNLLIKGLLHHRTDQCGDACDCIHKKNKGSSLKSCPVKVFVIRGFTGTMKEMNMIEHFLDYFPCLKEMNIYIEDDRPTMLRYDPHVAEHILEMIEEYNYSYSCNVQLFNEE